jgi:hypothetical protein
MPPARGREETMVAVGAGVATDVGLEAPEAVVAAGEGGS